MPDDPHNAADPPSSDEGKGGFRSEMRMLSRALREGWEVRPELRRAALARAANVLANSAAKPRDWARASRTILDIDRFVFDAALAEDRATRLDGGDPTSIIGVTPAALRAIADTIDPQPPTGGSARGADH